MRPTFLLLPVAAFVAGCQTPSPRNPDDPNQVDAARQPAVVKAYMKQMSEDVITPAVATGQITQAQGDAMMVQGAKEYLKDVHFKNTPPKLIWLVADAYLTAHEWQRAEDLLKQALVSDSDPDREVNDTLRLARCEAELGDVPDAIATARKSFSAPPEWKWPILYGVIYEIVPAAERTDPSAKIELAHFVEDAIRQHEAATGSIEDPVRKLWVVTRDIHISRAWNLVVKLYTDANRPDLAKQAAGKANLIPKRPANKAIEA